jgi:MbtH protein
MMQEEDTRDYVVLVNGEMQYSLWLKELPIPRGWQPTGFEGKKAECSEHVDRVWTDMRPLSLRKKMDGAAVS